MQPPYDPRLIIWLEKNFQETGSGNNLCFVNRFHRSILITDNPALGGDLQRATDDFVTGYERAFAVWLCESTVFQQVLAEQLPPAADLYQALTSPEGVPALEGVFGAAQNFFSILGRIALIVILKPLLECESIKISSAWVSPVTHRTSPQGFLKSGGLSKPRWVRIFEVR